MAKLFYKPKEEMYLDDNYNGQFLYPVYCGNCKEDLTQVNWEWWNYCANCGAKLDNVQLIKGILDKKYSVHISNSSGRKVNSNIYLGDEI